MKKIMIAILCMIMGAAGVGCAAGGEAPDADISKTGKVKDKYITVGFSQLGAESDWRSANTQSIQETLSLQNGYEMTYENGQQKQENQIMAIRKFIQQDVDYIILAPVEEKGWDTVLQEVKEKKIPVILVDRMVDVEDNSLYTSWVGSDFELEGKKVCEWIRAYTKQKGIPSADIHIVDIQGTIGASSQIGRTRGLESCAKRYGWEILEKASGEYTQAKGREVMEAFLKRYNNINVVYCENDNEAFGAIEAIRAAGKEPGNDIMHGQIMVVSFDGVTEKSMQYVAHGMISCIAECNPQQGSRVQAIIDTLEAGKTPDKKSYVSENIFCADSKITQITVEGTNYPVTIITKEKK